MVYHQIDMDPRDIDRTAYSTKEGHWAYKRMHYRLKTAPATFQKTMKGVLSGLRVSQYFVFLDDIVNYANCIVDHDRKLRDVFETLRKYDINLQPDKREFLRKEVTFVGHKISERGFQPDTCKLDAVKDFPTPKTVKQLRSFLGIIEYYRKFIPNSVR